MPRRPATFALACWLILIAHAGAAPRVSAEPGGPAELERGRSVESSAARGPVGTRSALLRSLAREHAAEIDSLEALLGASPARAATLAREIEAAKRRHAREEIELQIEVARRDGRVGLARRLELRLARHDAVVRGAR